MSRSQSHLTLFPGDTDRGQFLTLLGIYLKKSGSTAKRDSGSLKSPAKQTQNKMQNYLKKLIAPNLNNLKAVYLT
jgi:hypothetical protein